MDIRTDSENIDTSEKFCCNNETEDILSEPVNSNSRRKISFNRLSVVIGVIAIAVFVFGVYIAYTMFSCPRVSECRHLVNNFQVACNELDLRKIGNCIDPSTRSILYIYDENGATIEDIFGQLESFIRQEGGEEYQSFLNDYKILVDYINDYGYKIYGPDFQISDLVKTISITPTDYGMIDNPRTVTCRIIVSGIEHYVDVKIWKEYGEVYIDLESLLDFL